MTQARTIHALSAENHTLSSRCTLGSRRMERILSILTARQTLQLALSPGDPIKITYINDFQRGQGAAPYLHGHDEFALSWPSSSPKRARTRLEYDGHAGQSTPHTCKFRKIIHRVGIVFTRIPRGKLSASARRMSGALVIEGIESYVPALTVLPNAFWSCPGRSIEHDPHSARLKQRVELSSDVCARTEPADEISR